MQTIGQHIISTQLNDMVGREDEVNRICGLLSSCDEGLLWVHGPGGIGKTTVMYAVEKQLSSKHGFLWVDFGIGGFQDIAAIREMIAGHIRRSPEAAPLLFLTALRKQSNYVTRSSGV